MSTPEPVVEFLTRALDRLEQYAREAVHDAPWSCYSSDLDPTEGTSVSDADHDEVARPWDYWTGHHIAVNDPRAILARVAAERAIVQAFQDHATWANDPANYNPDAYARMAGTTLDAVRWLAWGHRHDAPGWQDAWAPEGAGAPDG